MACTDCKKTIQGHCKVCQLQHNDNSVKEVFYCEICGQYICEKCNKEWGNRTVSAIKEFFGKFIK